MYVCGIRVLIKILKGNAMLRNTASDWKGHIDHRCFTFINRLVPEVKALLGWVGWGWGNVLEKERKSVRWLPPYTLLARSQMLCLPFLSIPAFLQFRDLFFSNIPCLPFPWDLFLMF